MSTVARHKWKPALLFRKAIIFVLGSLLVGFLIIFFEKLLAQYLPRHFSVSLGVGFAVAIGLWAMKMVKHPPFILKRISPWIAGFCAGLGVHLARTWLR
jgi:hypothetical protein